MNKTSASLWKNNLLFITLITIKGLDYIFIVLFCFDIHFYCPYKLRLIMSDKRERKKKEEQR